jgi:hypothetical protein
VSLGVGGPASLNRDKPSSMACVVVLLCTNLSCGMTEGSCFRYGCEWLQTAVHVRNSEAQVQICNTTSPLLPGSDLLHARRHGSDSGRLGSACRGIVHTNHKISRDLRSHGCRQNKSGDLYSYMLGGLGGTYRLRTGGTG